MKKKMEKCLLNIILAELARAGASNEKLVQKSANKEKKTRNCKG